MTDWGLVAAKLIKELVDDPSFGMYKGTDRFTCYFCNASWEWDGGRYIARHYDWCWVSRARSELSQLV